MLGDKKITITIEMVDAQIPLLIGSYSMKLGNAVINFQDNTSTFFDEVVDMAEVGAGHFCIVGAKCGNSCKCRGAGQLCESGSSNH